MGKAKNDWQEREYILRWFRKKVGEAKQTYRRYVVSTRRPGIKERNFRV